ncbi:MAG: ribonuclease-3 [Paracoccaceae bacterium]|jgi:ribonuclease-3
MKLSADVQSFQKRLGHTFDDPALLINALTHPSMSGETRPSNQRLEFLGDRILNLIIAEALFLLDPDAGEGTLAPRYNVLVRKDACADVARDIGLGDVLKLGRSEMLTGGRRRQTSLADAMESVIAAIYLDSGLDKARKVVLTLWGDRIQTAEDNARDPKTALQEWAQGRGMAPPAYSTLKRSGPDHAPQFTILATLSNGAQAEATAGAKRQAEQAAARALLEQLEAIDG